MKNKFNKKYLKIILGVLILLVAISLIGPICFSRNGFLVKTKVEQYPSEYELYGTAKDNKAGTNIYLLYFGFKKINIEEEEMKFQGESIPVERKLPFLYTWRWESASAVYRIEVGSDKYYFTTIVN
ncbi:hypothetical protein LJC51_10210 [Lachnospiraceae bacterium OttesenSCG-928-J05]|nr:hypothetical protein [Lachnospiraceae bacterium OttesenSCG-928-J05]